MLPASVRVHALFPVLFGAALGSLAACGEEAASPPLGALLEAHGQITRDPAGRISPSPAATMEGIFDALVAPSRVRSALPAVTVAYPLDGSLFPPEIVAPTFLWHDDAEAANAWLIEIFFEDVEERLAVLVTGPAPDGGPIDSLALGPTNEVYEGTSYQRSAHSWTPSPVLWEAVKAHSTGHRATIAVSGFDLESPRGVLSRGRVNIQTSTDSVGAPIFYRDVPLMPSRGEHGKIQPLAKSGLPLISWRLRDISKPESRLLLTGMPSCANCHSFSLDGKTLGMDVDGPDGDKGAYAIAPLSEHMVITKEEVITWNSFQDKPEGHKTLGLFSRLSPDGRFAITTLNESIYIANFTDHRFLQVFYPTRGILAWYSTDSHAMEALPGADDPDYVHCNPAWWPDGEQIVFARARAFDPYEPGQPTAEYPNDPKEPTIRYDLYRMPFNGGRGGTSVPIEGASNNGMSNTFPKVSPDGNWIVYTRCRNGQLLRPDGRLWIVPAEGGEAREMTCNASLMNSWHSFSPNSRWLVFASKTNTPYTQMFLTHIDADGRDTPPILIPNSTAANRAVNIPEFLNAAYDSLLGIEVPAVHHHRLYRQGVALMRAGNYAEARDAFQQAIALERSFSRAHVNLAFCLDNLELRDEAVAHYGRALEINPADPLALNGLGALFMYHADLGRKDQAETYLRQALAADPSLHIARRNLGFLMADLGRDDEALVHLRQALAANPRDVRIHRSLAKILYANSRVDQALHHIEAIVAIDSQDVRTRTQCAWLLATLPDAELRDGDRAVHLARTAVEQTDGSLPGPLDALAAAYAETGAFTDAVAAAESALAVATRRELARDITRRLDLYRAEKPYRAAPR